MNDFHYHLSLPQHHHITSLPQHHHISSLPQHHHLPLTTPPPPSGHDLTTHFKWRSCESEINSSATTNKLLPAANYYCQAHAHNDKGWGLMNKASVLRTLDWYPYKCGRPKPVGNSSTSVMLEWKAPRANCTPNVIRNFEVGCGIGCVFIEPVVLFLTFQF